MGGVGCALPLGTMMGGVGRHWHIAECSAWTRMAGLNKKGQKGCRQNWKNTGKKLTSEEETEGEKKLDSLSEMLPKKKAKF